MNPDKTWFSRAKLASGLAVLLLGALGSRAQTEGIFADFTTSLGDFTCQLHYSNAPVTVANFIGLATGQRPWLDLVTGRARTDPLYSGLTFHRVIRGFMSQGGSPNGMGTDGPGYVFKDEFSPGLVFDRFGVLAMANSGPNSDGSQFFITVAPYSFGNNTYTIFGQVVAGSNVVHAINNVATGANDKPLTNVVIQQIHIRRVGAAAHGFNLHAQGLPLVTNLPLSTAVAGGGVVLGFDNRLYADNRLYSSTNLNAWEGSELGIEVAGPFTNQVRQSMNLPRTFYRLGQVRYASSTLAPKDLKGRTLALTLTAGGEGTLTVRFDSAGGGTFSFPPDPGGAVDGYNWGQEPYRGRLVLGLPGYPVLSVRCDFANGSGGSFSGQAYPNYPSDYGAFEVGGGFTLAGP